MRLAAAVETFQLFAELFLALVGIENAKVPFGIDDSPRLAVGIQIEPTLFL